MRGILPSPVMYLVGTTALQAARKHYSRFMTNIYFQNHAARLCLIPFQPRPKNLVKHYSEGLQKIQFCVLAGMVSGATVMRVLLTRPL